MYPANKKFICDQILFIYFLTQRVELFFLHLSCTKTSPLSFRKTISSFLLIRESESKLVLRLFAFEFFHGAAIAVFFTTGISIFLKHLPTADLAKVFILSAGLLWLTGFVYNKLEHALSVRSVVLSVLIFNALCIIIFRLLMPLENDPIILFLLLGFFNVLYLLNNLEFWGLAALLFDVRQSKRLFSIVSAGDIPAKMIGYISVALLNPLIGTENLLWVAAVFIICSFVIFPYLMRMAEVKELEHNHHDHKITESVQSIKAALSGNTLIRNVAFTSFFSFCFFIIVNYIFYGYVKHAFTSNRDLADFFAIFLVVIRAVTLFIKLFITNKLVDSIGLRRSMLITPGLLLIICVAAIIYTSKDISETETFYAFGILAAVTDVLRAAFQTPVLLVTLQPLPTHKRLRGHTIIKGLMDPFAFLTMGVLLWLLPSSEEHFNILGFVLLGLVVCWIVFAVLVDDNYAHTLTEAIRNRTLNERFISITDSESLALLLQKLKKGNETEAISILQLIAQQPINKKDFFEAGLQHSSPHVQQLTLQLIQTHKDTEVLPFLKKLLTTNASAELFPEIIKTLSLLDANEDMSAFLLHSNTEVVKEALIAQLKQKNESAKQDAEKKLQQLFQSKNDKDKIIALQVASVCKNEHFNETILQLMQHPNQQVQQAAFKAAAVSENALCVNNLFNVFVHTDDEKALEALKESEENCLPLIKNFLWKEKCEGTKCRKLISMIGKIKNKAALQLLEECIVQFPSKADIIMTVIFQNNIHPHRNLQPYKKTIHECLNAAANILYSINFLDQVRNTILIKALYLELDDLRNKCLDIFAFIYDAEKMRRAKIGFATKSKDAQANALELVQLTVPKEFGGMFTNIFEKTSIKDKITELRKIVPEPHITEDILIKNILFDVGYTFNNWTKSCALYSMKDDRVIINAEFIKPFLHAQNAVLKETAEYILKGSKKEYV